MSTSYEYVWTQVYPHVKTGKKVEPMALNSQNGWELFEVVTRPGFLGGIFGTTRHYGLMRRPGSPE